MNQILLFAAAAAASIPLFSPAGAEARAGEQTQVVRFADLDLGSEDGVRTLDRRIASAAAAVCGPTSDVDPAGKNKVRRCRETAIEEASTRRARVLASNARTSPAPIQLTLDRQQTAGR